MSLPNVPFRPLAHSSSFNRFIPLSWGYSKLCWTVSPLVLAAMPRQKQHSEGSLTGGLQKQTYEGIKQIGVNFDPALAFRHTQAVEDKPVEILTFQNHRDRVAVIRIVLIDPAAAAA